MQYYRFPDNKAAKLAFGVVLFLLLLVTRDTMFSMVTWGFYKCQFLMIGLICLLGVAFLIHNRRNLKAILTDRRMLALLISTVVLVVPMVIKRDWQLMYFSLLLGVYFAVFLSYFVTYKEASWYYVVILSALSVYSLIALYILRPLVDSGILSVPTVTNSHGRELYHFGMSFVSIIEVSNRNFGIFREPGVHQFFLMVGLFLTNYTVQWKKNWQMWLVNLILAVTMLSTFATGGVIEMGLFIVVLFFDRKWYADKRGRILAAAAVIAVAVVVAVSVVQKNGLYWALYEMIMKFVNNPESTGARLGSIAMGLEIFLHNPIFGASVEEVLHSVVDNTSSTLILYGLFGILGGTLNVAAWIALVWQKERKVWVNLALLVILFMSFNTQNLTWNIFFWLFPCMALVERGLPLLKLDRFAKKA